MIRTTTRKVLCPFLYPSACKHFLRTSQPWRDARLLVTSRPRWKEGEPSTLPSIAVPSDNSSPGSELDTGKAPGSGNFSDKDVNKLRKMPTIREAARAAEEQMAMEEEELKKDLAVLRRPLGVPKKPTTKRKSWKEQRAELVEGDVYAAEHKHIVKQLVKGGLRDLHLLRYHGGKLWISPKTLIRQDIALYLPDLTGTPLDRTETVHTTDICADKVSVVAFTPVQIASQHCASFMKLTLESFEKDPDFRYIQINLQENYLKSLLVSMFKSRLRHQIPSQQHSTYLLSSQNMEYLREPLGMINKHIGYVFLVDAQLKVRWAGCGFANADEQVALHECVGVLLNRLKAKKDG